MKIDDQNVVLVVVDTLSAFNLSLYGHDKETAPFLSDLAKDNVLFNYAYSNAPWTVPSHASIFSGKLPGEHGTDSSSMIFTASSFVEDLSQDGYKTFGLSANSLVSANTGFDKGFDKLLVGSEIPMENMGVGTSAWQKIHEKNYDSNPKKYFDFVVSSLKKGELTSLKEGFRYFFRKRRENQRVFYSEKFGARDIVDVFKNKMEEDIEDEANFFLFANFMEVHEYSADMEYMDEDIDYEKAMETKRKVEEDYGFLPEVSQEEKRHMRALYDAQIRYVDEKLEEIYHSIREEHPETVFIFTSDHGQNIGHYNGMWDHQHGILERLIRVPLIIAGQDFDGKEIEGNVALRDLSKFIKGDIEEEELAKDNVYAEYKGSKHFYIDFQGRSWDDYPEEKRRYLKNKSKAVVSGNKGLVRNSNLDNHSFEADIDGFKDSWKGLEEQEKLENLLDQKFGLLQGIDF